MTPALGTDARPLRLLVVGSSCAYMVVPREHHDDQPYGLVTAQLLHAGGIRTRVAHSCRWFGMIHQVRHRYERLRDAMPDVVVIHHGVIESQPAVVPSRLMAHMTTWDRSTHPLALAYRDHLADPAWARLRELQRWAAPRAPRSHRLAPARFGREVQQLARLLRDDLRALVLFLDVDPPGPRLRHWLPGIEERVAQTNHALDRAVGGLEDPDVRVVRASSTVDDVDALLPDGLHRTAEGHRRTAALLSHEIAGWVRDRSATAGPTA